MPDHYHLENPASVPHARMYSDATHRKGIPVLSTFYKVIGGLVARLFTW